MWKCNKKVGERGGGGGPVEGEEVGGCEPRIEVIVKMQKQSRGSVGGRVGGWWGSGGCEVVIIVKMQKKVGDVRSGGGRVDVNQGLKL